jgi:hypothetical protein
MERKKLLDRWEKMRSSACGLKWGEAMQKFRCALLCSSPAPVQSLPPPIFIVQLRRLELYSCLSLADYLIGFKSSTFVFTRDSIVNIETTYKHQNTSLPEPVFTQVNNLISNMM